MADQVAVADWPQPHLEIIFNPQEQVRPDAVQISGAIKIIPRNFLDVGSASDSSFGAVLFDGTGSMDEDESGKTNHYRNKRLDGLAGGEPAIKQFRLEQPFALYTFDRIGRRVYPTHGKPKPATTGHLDAAVQAWKQIKAQGETFMSEGIKLVLADFLSLEDCDEGTCALVTDGKNDRRDRRALREVLAQIEQYRALGKILKIQPISVGPEIDQPELKMIQQACLADSIQHIPLGAGPQPWTDAFSRIFTDLSLKVLREVQLSFTELAPGTRVLSLWQQRPVPLDLTGKLDTSGDEATQSLIVGAWEAIKYRLFSFSLAVQKPFSRDDLEAACLQISYKIGRKNFTTDPLPIRVRWTNITSLSNRLPSPEMAEAMGVQGSVEAITRGIALLERGDKAGARTEFQKAYDLARQIDDQRFIDDLKGFMHINEETHTVEVKALSKEDSFRLDNLSHRRDGE